MMNSVYTWLFFFAGLQTGIPTTTAANRPQRITAVIHDSGVQVSEVGSTVRYQCDGQSEDNDTISTKWWKESGRIPSGRSYADSRGTLIIRDLKVSDSGVYVCQVSDGVNIATQKLDLIVEETCEPPLPSSPPNPTIAPLNWVGKSGDTVYLVCIIPLKGARISWTRTGNTPLPVSATVQDGTLTIPNADPSDSGIYVCTANFNRYPKTSAIASVSVRSLTRPSVVRVDLDRQIVTEGTLLQMRCVVVGDPTPCLITWTKFGQPIGPHVRTEGNILWIDHARVSDEGTYECHATNSEGISSVGQARVRVEPYSTTTEITVTDAPPPVRIIVTITTSAKQIVEAGSSVTYQCSGRAEDGRPIRIEWRKENGQISANRGYQDAGTLYLENLKISDSGVYICQVSDGVVTAVQKVTLTVENERLVKPRPVIQPRYLNVQEGNPVEFRCEASGNPPPELSWIRVRGQMNPTAVFENGIWSLPYARKTDEAEYKCIARNSVGTTEVRTILYVTGHSVPPPAPPSPVIEPTNWIGGTSDTIRLVCTAPRGAKITWTKSENPDLVIQQGSVLTIYNPSPSDSGYYTCIAITYEGVETSSTARVTVQPPLGRPPTVRVEPERQEVSQGTLIEVKCIVTGDPTPVVTWTKFGKPLGSHIQTEGNTLRILNPRVSDRGTYVCRATNSRGSAECSAVIDVNRREMPVIELYPQKNQVVRINGSAVLQCRVVKGLPVPSVSWSREDGRPFSSNVQQLPGGILRFNSVTLEDGGSFVCSASNNVGSTSLVAVLEITTPPVITITPSNRSPLLVRLGERVQLTCTASGQPKPMVMWNEQKTQVTPYAANPRARLSVAVHEINSVSYGDEGTYTCSAVNSFGPVEDRIQIRIADNWVKPDTSTLRPSSSISEVGITISEDTLRVPDGGKVQMHCQVYGSTGETIYLDWKRNDGRRLPQLSSVHNGILLIPAVTKDDAGAYVCQGLNRNGTVLFTTTAYLEIIFPPKIVLDPVQQVVREGESPSINCRVTGDRPIEIEWRAIGRPLPYTVSQNDGLLQFNRIIATDAGKYICKATNNVGTAEAVAEVLVDAGSVPQPKPPPPVIEPTYWTGRTGETIRLVCTASPGARITWTKSKDASLPVPVIQQGGILTIYNSSPFDSGYYTCIAVTYEGVETSSTARVMVQPPLGRPPTVRVEPERQQVSQGTLVEVKCIATGYPTPVVTWTKLGKPLGAHVQTVGNTLRIINPQDSDQGIYVCRATNNGGSAESSAIIDINLPPRIELEPIEQVVRQGESPSINCRVTGNQPINIEWRAIGRPLPYTASQNGGLLQFNRISAADTGKYLCKATNNAGTTEAVAEVLVDATPVPIIEPTYWTGKTGETIRLVCTASPGARITWSKSGNASLPVSVIHQGSVLTIYNSSPSDSGYYTCIAVTYEGVETSSTARVTVQPPLGRPPTVRVEPERQQVSQGTLVEVKCIATGYPTPVVTWTKLGEPLGAHVQTVGNTLRIINPQGSDQGIYVCRATNNGGSAESRAVIDINLRETPVIVLYPPKDQVVPINGSAVFQCTATAGFPKPSITWARVDGKPFSSNVEQLPDGILRFNSVTLEDGGAFVCLASNEVGSISKIAILEITTPPIITITPSNGGTLSFRIGERMQLTCTATGHPQPWVVWNKHKTGVPLDAANPRAMLSMAVHEISSVSHEHEGTYTCSARNSYGVVEQSIQIRVEDRYSNVSQVGVVITEDNLRIPDGEKAEVRCQVFGNPQEPIYLDWKRSDGRSLSQQSSVRDGILLIPAVSKDDAGEYICQGLNSNGTVLYTTTTFLEIIFPPRITLDPIAQVVRQGESPSVNCQVTGEQPITIEWYALGRPLPYTVSQDQGLLQFTGITFAEAGKYVCKATNNFGTTEAIAQITVNEFDPCIPSPCVHGTCQSTQTGNYTCICEIGYTGRNCESIWKQCEPLNPCKNGGICTDFPGGYKCDCQLGFNGPRCEFIVEIFMDAGFRGNGWLELERSITSDEEVEFLAFEISTNKSSGLVMWHGQTPMDLNPDDYIALAVVDGYVEYQYNLGSGPAVVRITDRRVDDGERHRIVLTRDGCEGTIELNGKYIESGMSQGLQQLLNARGSFYLGGVPDYAMTYGTYQDGFTGCIYTLQVQDSGAVVLGDKAIRGINVYACTSEYDRPPIRGDGGHVE